ncbi:MAG: DUF5658 family protein [Gammaproteobacteria bacterium]|nr:DUF5658 family protein [Gammaproteobacteria bacterium]MDH3374075.1 DUF5658 family protein [Gammaproteobacteria bacterium]MDH3552338.1 DUF5658 family protein [Gammaproteobacteria bacterium]
MDLSDAIVEQRSVADRRIFSWRTIYYGFMRSRRHNLRRGQEQEVRFLDWHHPWLFFLAVGTMLMSCADAFMTLQLLDRGMVEANPIMASMIGQGATAFAVSKMVMTGTSILTLVFLAKARFMNRMRIGALLTVVFSLYACLVCYEFVHLIRDM